MLCLLRKYSIILQIATAQTLFNKKFKFFFHTFVGKNAMLETTRRLSSKLHDYRINTVPFSISVWNNSLQQMKMFSRQRKMSFKRFTFQVIFMTFMKEMNLKRKKRWEVVFWDRVKNTSFRDTKFSRNVSVSSYYDLQTLIDMSSLLWKQKQTTRWDVL